MTESSANQILTFNDSTPSGSSEVHMTCKKKLINLLLFSFPRFAKLCARFTNLFPRFAKLCARFTNLFPRFIYHVHNLANRENKLVNRVHNL